MEMHDEDYKKRYVFGTDYGTSEFKYGPITQGERPLVVENRGYFPEKTILSQIMGVDREVIVGKDITLFLESGAELATRLIYPMREGIIMKDDVKAWKVVRELMRHALEEFKPKGWGFNGFYVVAALSAVAPRYMYEKFFEMLESMAKEAGLVHSATIISQPLAVAIAHKKTSCVVVESGHGNTQFAPISRAPIRGAVIALNRGGSDANAIMTEILKDAGYGDLAAEETLVRKVKENLGLLPADLNSAISFAKNNPDAVRTVYSVPGTRLKIDLAENSWTRFLVGEYVFNPNHEIFQSYFKRGMPRPRDTKVGDVVFYGMLNMAEAIISAVEKCPVELQPLLYSQILLSGGNFSWRVPEKLKNVCVDSATKIKRMMAEKGIENIEVTMASEPQYSVWRGCIVYGYAVPASYSWSWEKMEGWMNFCK